MSLIILGVLLWSTAHLFKRLAPDARRALQDKMGNASKALFAVALAASVVLMVVGYKGNTAPILYVAPDWAVHVNNTLMLIAIALFGVGNSQSHLRGAIRHPMLIGFLLWTIAHLLVNGDLASIVLFGGLGVWALAAIVLINRQDTGYVRWTGGTLKGDLRLGLIALVLYGVATAIHWWLGVRPFPMVG
ncbi:NnrU protein [Rhodovulum imhoffii]|uniref:NnrU protein n=1 Tax=Rhodovulum imhoffii TaxID=365340 RepID=A0A2T5BRT8_9RHOB|nr:NnrU family protein [Rhodovulum imhoffii]MBK5933264.1 hypothetical protein [Rhodovulum imhoffii]PTN01999.1 NnrU protein [Rhodovulum imhoffii]